MKNSVIIILLLSCYSLSAQETVEIDIPETYELSNIILALTDYGRTDKWEVQKGTSYYNKVLVYFDQVKNHPLLDSVNYSRERWEDYLSFRTDAFAFSFDGNNRLKRNFNFYSVEGHTPFDNNIDLVNDFVEKSNYRKFYEENIPLYREIVSHYKDYYFLDMSKSFLEKNIGKPSLYLTNRAYKVILSPLVFRMNCHRNIDSLTAADFPSLSKELINGNSSNDTVTRIIENHTLFTEMDHEFINPVSEKYKKQILETFNLKYWDNESGYLAENSFNEYMTWAVYDIFVKENFPSCADSVSLQWHYQNASRGFIASNLFAQKVLQLFFENKGKAFDSIYPALLNWCKDIQDKIKQPALTNVKAGEFVSINQNELQLEFTDKMDTKINSFGVIIAELNNGEQTGKIETCIISQKRNKIEWLNKGKKLKFKIKTDFKEYAVVFNWWGIGKPLLSESGILLKPQSYIFVKNQK